MSPLLLNEVGLGHRVILRRFVELGARQFGGDQQGGAITSDARTLRSRAPDIRRSHPALPNGIVGDLNTRAIIVGGEHRVEESGNRDHSLKHVREYMPSRAGAQGGVHV